LSGASIASRYSSEEHPLFDASDLCENLFGNTVGAFQRRQRSRAQRKHHDGKSAERGGE